MTIAGLMMIVAFIALELWLFRAAVTRRVSLPLLLAIAAGYGVVIPPLVLKGRHWHSDDPHYEPIDPGSEQVPLRVAESVAEAVPELKALGFRLLGHFRSDRSVPNTASYVSLFENREKTCTSQVFTVFAATGPVRLVSTVLNFKTEFTDGTSLITANSQLPNVFPTVRRREGSMSFPWITEPRDLYEIHEASVAHYAPDGIPIELEIEDPAEFLRSSSRRELAEFVEIGYHRHDERRRVYRLTWMGAFLIAWKLTWPIKPIRQWIRRRGADRILRELGLDRLAPGS
jgi:hypothetical protein